MNSKIKAVGIATLTALIALPVFAQGVDVGARVGVEANTGAGGVGVQADAKIEARMTLAKERADQEIERRINRLNELNVLVQAMKRVSAQVKANIAAGVQTEISNLTALNAKIQGDPDFDLLRVDIKSIATSYRIFMLIIPQGRIIVAADKVNTVAENMLTFSGKLSSRIADAKTSGENIASMEASLSDTNAKIANAKVEADAAVALVVNLSPDEGNKTKMDSNNQALKDARAKVKVALENLRTAREDARLIVNGLKDFSVKADASASGEVQ